MHEVESVLRDARRFANFGLIHLCGFRLFCFISSSLLGLSGHPFSFRRGFFSFLRNCGLCFVARLRRSNSISVIGNVSKIQPVEVDVVDQRRILVNLGGR